MSSEARPGPQLHPVQSVIDALSVALGRPVLLDDEALVPIAYSPQWEVDTVRSQSILGRGASPAVRAALLAQDIAGARDFMRTAADPTLGMWGRVCMPVRDAGDVVGYLWVLDPRGELTDGDLGHVRRAAGEIAALLAATRQRASADEAALVEALRSSDPAVREQAATTARDRRLLVDEQVVLCLLAARTPGVDALAGARHAARQLSAGHAIVSATAEGAAVIAGCGDPVLRTLAADDVGAWVHAAAAVDVAVGQAAATSLSALDAAARQAYIALRVARSRPPDAAVVAWSAMGADRLIAQLPAGALRDVPERLAHLLREDRALVETLAAFLEAAGDIKAAAAALSLHRSGLYYRLSRIEELTGLDLARGDDRLLAHLAIRARQMS
jgi:PucR C-terminal helix-turn-helix domain